MIALLAAVLTGCALNPALAPDLSLHDRFVLNALTDDLGDPVDQLLKWSWPLLVSVEGDPTYYADVERQVIELGDITGLRAEMVNAMTRPNIVVTFGSRAELQSRADEVARRRDLLRASRFTCWFSRFGAPQRFRAEIYIRSDMPADKVRLCIAQELAQVLGPAGDIDGRTDTAFASGTGTDHLTEADRQIFALLYDSRLRSGMSRADVLAILPAIVAELEAEAASRRSAP
jgi:hypothetical protein